VLKLNNWSMDLKKYKRRNNILYRLRRKGGALRDKRTNDIYPVQ